MATFGFVQSAIANSTGAATQIAITLPNVAAGDLVGVVVSGLLYGTGSTPLTYTIADTGGNAWLDGPCLGYPLFACLGTHAYFLCVAKATGSITITITPNTTALTLAIQANEWTIPGGSIPKFSQYGINANKNTESSPANLQIVGTAYGGDLIFSAVSVLTTGVTFYSAGGSTLMNSVSAS